jgi:hypothetical protein
VDPTAVLILGVLWFLINLMTGGKKKVPPPRVPRREPLPPAQPTSPDATQREGSRLEMVLREFERALEEAGSAGRREHMELPGAEEVEERESLEQEPEVVSLEQEVRRTSRREYTQDEGAEKLVQQRIAAAAARDTARTRPDHLEFDQRIRQEPADHTAVVGYTAKQLRDAVVWREILGPPVSEREGREVRGER